ncbi:unnamed protein product, partial [Hapterophycus canaliculatus]
QDAGAAYKQCGRLEERLNNPEVAASLYHEAALCFQKDDPQEAAVCYLSAINLFCQGQRFSTAARLECEVAELMQSDRNRRLAIVHFLKAADFYRASTCFDEATDRCLLKASTLQRAAHTLGLGQSYLEAAALFQEVGRRMLVDDLLKFNTPDTFLKSVLCLQCASGMPQSIPQAHHQITGDDPSLPRPTINSVKATILSLGKACSVFQGSRAYMFASDVALAEKEGDIDFFAARLYAYNNVCRLDAWYMRMLQTISDHVQMKAIKLKKMRAVQATPQEKIRRKQRAEERARDRIKRRQDLSKQDDSSEGALSETDDSSSSEAILPSDEKSQPKAASSSPSPSSESGSSSDSSSSSNSGRSGSSASSSNDSESSSDTGTSSSSGSSVTPNSGTSGGADSSGESATLESPIAGSTGKKEAGRSAGRDSPTLTQSSSASTKSNSSSRHSKTLSVDENSPQKTRKKGLVGFEEGYPFSESNSSRSYSARSAGAEATTNGERGEERSSSESSNYSIGFTEKAGKQKGYSNTREHGETEQREKARPRFWKKG